LIKGFGFTLANADGRLPSLLFERLLEEVQRVGLPFEECAEQARGEFQARAFWENVRMQLKVEDDEVLKLEWPEGYPELVEGRDA
jgi:hypothetical protein